MKIRKVLTILAIAILPAIAVPQSGGTFVIQKSVIAGGGGTASRRDVHA